MTRIGRDETSKVTPCNDIPKIIPTKKVFMQYNYTVSDTIDFVRALFFVPKLSSLSSTTMCHLPPKSKKAVPSPSPEASPSHASWQALKERANCHEVFRDRRKEMGALR
jgi:hypothetical protein